MQFTKPAYVPYTERNCLVFSERIYPLSTILGYNSENAFTTKRTFLHIILTSLVLFAFIVLFYPPFSHFFLVLFSPL